MLQDILLVILILDGIALTAIILLQKSEGGGLVSGGGGGQFMTARGTANLLTRTTEILTGIFFITALAITIVIGRTSGNGGSVVDKVNVQGLSAEALAAQQKQQAAAMAAAQKQAQGGVPTAPEAPAPTLGTAPAAPPPVGALPFSTPPAGPTH
jgi:preprotein translocase subunit SecG